MSENSLLLFDFDKSFNKKIVGTDEACRGPGAGGVFPAAVYFDKITDGLVSDLAILNDSKKLTAKKRDSIFDVIKNNTINKIVCIEVDEIEKINILNASLKAMNLACTSVIEKIEEKLPIKPFTDEYKGIEEFRNKKIFMFSDIQIVPVIMKYYIIINFIH